MEHTSKNYLNQLVVGVSLRPLGPAYSFNTVFYPHNPFQTEDRIRCFMSMLIEAYGNAFAETFI